MLTISLLLSTAFLLGLGARLLGLPPLVGFLAAGFLLSSLGYNSHPALQQIAHLGVLVLLFSVGLKLRIRSLLRPEIFAGALLHLIIAVAIAYFVLAGSYGLPDNTLLLIAIALGFSSTVVAAKVLESKQELRAFHGRVVIGILIVQDILAVAVLSLAGVATPSPWSLLIPVVFLLRPVIYRLLHFCGHGEMLVLFGLLLALVIGGASFEALGLSSELGALLVGVLLSEHKRAMEMSHALWGLKEVLLVGFFLQIGLTGHPDLQMLGTALLLLLFIPLKAVLFFFILLQFKLRARSSFLAAISLATYSEFGLIIADVGVRNGWLSQEWMIILALAVGLSFVLASPFARYAHNLFTWLEPLLCRFESKRRHPDDKPISVEGSEIVIVGMGRVGTGAYDFLKQQQFKLIGLDSDPMKVEQHQHKNRHVIYADSEDPGLWDNIQMKGVKAVLLCMPDMEAKRFAINKLRKSGYRGVINATALFHEEVERLKKAGADEVYNYYDGVGVGFAEYIIRDIEVDNHAP